MTDRDRLAADLQAADDEWMADPNEDVNADGPHWTVFIADRLIALGWTQTTTEAEAVTAALDALAAEVNGMDGYDALWEGGDLIIRADVLARIEKARR